MSGYDNFDIIFGKGQVYRCRSPHVSGYDNAEYGSNLSWKIVAEAHM